MRKLLNEYQLNREFIKLINQCDEFYMMVAWATDECPAFRFLMKNASKIKKAVVGLDFNHTSPNFIKKTMKKNAHVRFVCGNKGVFHPKIYIFKNKKNRKTSVIIGSSNFTRGGLSKNYEISILLQMESRDTLLIDLIQKVDEKYKEARRMGIEEIKNYENQYKKNRNENKKENKYESIKNLKGFDMGWNEFVKMIEYDSVHSVESCIKILQEAKEMLRKGFNNFEEAKKGLFVGKYRWDDDKTDWFYFGDMRRVLPKSFRKWGNIGKALDCIPNFGKDVEWKHYQKFFEFIDRCVKIEKGISFASRLLCFKRPDVFVSVTSTNKTRLRELFGMRIGTRDEYWEFIRELQMSKWYYEFPKKHKWHRYRMALLDAIAYNP